MSSNSQNLHIKRSTGDIAQVIDRSFGILEFGIDGNIINANDIFLNMCGYELEELIGKNHKMLCISEHIISDEYAQTIQNILEKRQVSGLFSRLHKDGSTFWVEATYYTIVSPTGEPQKIIKFCLDVTPRQEYYLDRISRLDAIDRGAIMAEYSGDGIFLDINDNFLTIMGYHKEDILGQPITKIFSTGDSKFHLSQEAWNGICAGHNHCQLLRFHGGNDSDVWLETMFTPIFSSHGKLRKVVQVSMDISEAAKADEKTGRMFRQMSMVTDKTSNPVFITNIIGKTIYINESFTRMFGYTREEIMGKSPTVIFGPDESNIMRQIRKGLAESASCHMEVMAFSKKGQRFWVSCISNQTFDASGKREYVINVITDITETKLHETLQHKALEAMACDVPTEEVLNIICTEVEKILPGVSVAVIGMDKNRNVYPFASPSVDLKHMDISEFFAGEGGSPSGRAAYLQGTIVENDIAGSDYSPKSKAIFGAWEIHACLAKAIKASKGAVMGTVSFYFKEHYKPSEFDERVAGVVARICSIALEQHENKATMRTLCFYDALTGLPNRNLLYASAEQAISRAMSFNPEVTIALMFINIDKFTRFKKASAYQIGNEVLGIMGKRLLEIKNPRDIVGHLTGDEFVLIMLDCSPAQAMEASKRIQHALSRPCALEKGEIVVSVSIGVSLYPDNGINIDLLINCATLALSQSKKKGTGQIRFYDKTLNTIAHNSISLESSLHKAIDQRKLQLHYQPQIYLQTGKLHGVEALCRWNDAERGQISPAKFIPLAEEVGLINNLSAWVLHEACRQMGEWRRRGVGVPSISVNLSSANFHDPDLPEKILACLRENHLAPNDLILELTENVLLDQDPSTISTIHKAHGMGLALSLDDFGTGYSSLSYLRQLPISEMKLDQSFVRDMHMNELSQRLSQAVMRIGESLELIVLAEGIENEEQYNLLKKQQYHVGQGYFMSRPVPSDELETWLEKWRANLSQEQYNLVS